MVDQLEESTERLDVSLPPPLFDERATAHAQPVQLIASNKFVRWLERLQIRKIFTGRVFVLAIVIVCGFVAGAAGAAMFVKHEVANESLPPSEEQSAVVEEANNKDGGEEATSATIGGVTLPSQRARERHRRGRSSISRGQSRQRAYKVATIR